MILQIWFLIGFWNFAWRKKKIKNKQKKKETQLKYVQSVFCIEAEPHESNMFGNLSFSRLPPTFYTRRVHQSDSSP